MNYFVISNDGVLSRHAMLRELTESKIAPILVYQKGDQIFIPMFKTKHLAEKFGNKNLPSSHILGVMPVSNGILSDVKKMGWEPKETEWHQRVVDPYVEVLSLEREVEVSRTGAREEIR
jgi:hypothetical protein